LIITKIRYEGSFGSIREVKGVISRVRVDALSGLCSPFLKGGNSVFVAVVRESASGFFHKMNIDHSNNYGPNRNKIGSSLLKLSNLRTLS